MKRLTIALLLAAFAAAAPLKAQDKGDSFFGRLHYEYYVGGGLGYYDQVFSGEDNTAAEEAIGFSWKIGVTAVYPFSSKFSIDAGLGFISKGGGAKTWLTGLGDPIQENFDYAFQYISLPVHFRFYVLPDVYIFAGPEFGYGVRFAQNGKALKNYTKPFGVSIEYGAAFYLSGDWFLGAAFSNGLTKALVKGSQSKTPHSIMLTTGFNF